MNVQSKWKLKVKVRLIFQLRIITAYTNIMILTFTGNDCKGVVVILPDNELPTIRPQSYQQQQLLVIMGS